VSKSNLAAPHWGAFFTGVFDMAILEIDEDVVAELLEKLEFNNTAVSALDIEVRGLKALLARTENALLGLLTATHTGVNHV
jgi:hypothetical protein